MRGYIKTLVVFLLLFPGVLSATNTGIEEITNFDDCVEVQGGLYEALIDAHKKCLNVEEILDTIEPNILSPDDKKLMIYFVRNKEPKKIYQGVTLNCALDYPESSPFSPDQIRELRVAEKQATKTLVLGRHESSNADPKRNSYTLRKSPFDEASVFIANTFARFHLEGTILVLLSLSFRKWRARVFSLALFALGIGWVRVRYPFQTNNMKISYWESIIQAYIALFSLLVIFSTIKYLWSLFRNRNKDKS